MVYCGYTEISIVIIFISLIYILIRVVCGFLFFVMNVSVYVINMKVINVGYNIDWEIIINMWNLLFLVLVLIIRIRVIFFSISYISRISVRNFILLYLSFVFRMLWLVLNNNFYWMILGWDGLGVVSFLLIVFYINNERILNGLFTLFQNRLGDMFFVFFILGLGYIRIRNTLVLKIGLVALILGSFVKRAQFPFHSWLLAAIRAPTPISSLVHSSTLVVAGVYILLQFSYCLCEVLDYITYIRLLTLVIRRFGLLNEGDMKKLIAYSTIRHVALMLYIIRFGFFKIVYFHLRIHAIFKSLIFMCFGFVILSSFHRQDKRLVSYVNLSPIVKVIYIFSCLCLGGLPFLRAFFSKDLIIEKLINSRLRIFFVITLILCISLRVYYSMKLLKLNRIIFSYVLVEKNNWRLIRIVIIILVRIVNINIYLSLVFRLRLEFISVKLRIYLLIIIIFFIRVFTQLNYKLMSYSKVVNWKEIWRINFIKVDYYIYWNMFVILNQVNIISQIKWIVIVNWWVFIYFIWLFYEISFNSVTLKQSRDYHIFYGVKHMSFSLIRFR